MSVGPGTRLLLHAIQGWDRARLRRLQRAHPGLQIDPRASTNLGAANFQLGDGARLQIGAEVVTERRPDGLRFVLGAGAEVSIGERTWLCSERGPVLIIAFPGARLEIGPEGYLNGCHLSAKERVALGRKVWVGPGARVFDADQHALDADTPEQIAPVAIDDFCWIGSDVTVLKGVHIGAHCVVGARSLVTRSLEPHTLAYGVPARAGGRVGDRRAVEI